LHTDAIPAPRSSRGSRVGHGRSAHRMSDNINDQVNGDPGDDGTNVVQIPRANIRKLEKAADEGRKAQAELAALRREMTFREAGIDPSNAAHKYFIKGYDGEVSLDAIKAAAAEAGFLATQGQQQQQQEQQQEPQFQPPPSEYAS